MRTTLLSFLIAGGALFAVAMARPPAAEVREATLPGSSSLESPGGGSDCFEWTYPKVEACGALGGTTECKGSATIESSADEKKKADCRPTKGDLCLCD